MDTHFHDLDMDPDPLVSQLKKDKDEAQEKVQRAEQQLKKDNEEAHEKIRLAEEEVRKARREAEEAKAEAFTQKQAAEAESNNYVDPLAELDTSMLPQLPDPTAQDLPTLDRVWHVIHFSRWSAAATMINAEVLGISMDHLKSLVGPLWGKVYPDAEPTVQQPLSMTIIALLDIVITRIATQLARRPQEERNTTKQEAKAALESAPTKRRTEEKADADHKPEN